MTTISQEKDLEMLKKNSDGTFTKYNPKTKAANVTCANGNSVESELAHIAKETVPFGVATGNNDYSITITTNYTQYENGMRIDVAIPNTSTGNTSLNINNFGVIPILKPNGSNVINLKANGVYSFVYYNGNFTLQGEGGEYGTATADKVLSGYTIGTPNGVIGGTMVNNGTVILTPNRGYVSIPKGYHNGSGYVKGDNDLLAENIKSGVDLWGVVGSFDGSTFNPITEYEAHSILGSFIINDSDWGKTWWSEPVSIREDHYYVVYPGSTSSSIKKYDNSGTLLSSISIGEISSPTTSSTYGNGFKDFFIAIHRDTCIIRKFKWDGTLLATSQSGSAMAAGRTIFDEDMNAFTSWNNTYVRIYNKTGTLLNYDHDYLTSGKYSIDLAFIGTKTVVGIDDQGRMVIYYPLTSTTWGKSIWSSVTNINLMRALNILSQR